MHKKKAKHQLYVHLWLSFGNRKLVCLFFCKQWILSSLIIQDYPDCYLHVCEATNNTEAYIRILESRCSPSSWCFLDNSLIISVKWPWASLCIHHNSIALKNVCVRHWYWEMYEGHTKTGLFYNSCYDQCSESKFNIPEY